MTIQPATYSYGIDFLSDEILEHTIAKLLARVQPGRHKSNPHRNVIDPFAAAFEATSLALTLDDWFPTETARQINKAVTNAVGDFHQELLGHLPGWRSTGTTGGFIDLRRDEPFGVNNQPALAEVKNKFNTMNSGGQQKIYDNFQNMCSQPEYKKHTFYLIEVIQKTPSGDVEWAPGNRATRPDIRRIGAAQVYAESTGQPDAFAAMFRAVVQVLTKKHDFHNGNDSVTTIDDLFTRAYPTP